MFTYIRICVYNVNSVAIYCTSQQGSMTGIDKFSAVYSIDCLSLASQRISKALCRKFLNWFMHFSANGKNVHWKRIPNVKGNSHKRKLTHKKVFVENHFLDAHVCKYFMALTKAELVGSSSPFLSFFPKPSLLVQSANWTQCEWHKVAAGNDDWTLKLSSAQTDSTLSLLLSLTPAVALTLLSLSSLSLSRIQLELEISSGLCEFCLLLCECCRSSKNSQIANSIQG